MVSIFGDSKRVNLLIEIGLLHDYYGNFSMQGERYYFHMEGSTQGEIEPTQGEIEMNIRKCRKFKILFWMEGTVGD